MNHQNQTHEHQHQQQQKPALEARKAVPGSAYPSNTRNPASWTDEQRRAYRMERARAKDSDTYLTAAEGGGAVVLSERSGVLVAMGFRAKSIKPNFHFRYESAEQRQARCESWIASESQNEAEKAARRKERSAPTTLKVGDVLVASWGYEQTNVDFYEVVAVRGSVVEIREIDQERQATGDMTGTCMPKRGEYVGGVIRKRPNAANAIKVSCATAVPWDGCRKSWTAYA